MSKSTKKVRVPNDRSSSGYWVRLEYSLCETPPPWWGYSEDPIAKERQLPVPAGTSTDLIHVPRVREIDWQCSTRAMAMRLIEKLDKLMRGWRGRWWRVSLQRGEQPLLRRRTKKAKKKTSPRQKANARREKSRSQLIADSLTPAQRELLREVGSDRQVVLGNQHNRRRVVENLRKKQVVRLSKGGLYEITARGKSVLQLLGTK